MTDNSHPDHELKTEQELYDEYLRLREHLAVFWMYRPKDTGFRGTFPDTVVELSRRVEFLEGILQIPPAQQFNYKEYDHTEIS